MPKNNIDFTIKELEELRERATTMISVSTNLFWTHAYMGLIDSCSNLIVMMEKNQSDEQEEAP